LYKCETADEDTTEEEEEVDENDVNYSGNSTMIIHTMITNGEKVRILARVLFYNAKIATNILATDLGVIAKRRKQIVFVCRK
jgi:hypothetical protein